MQLASCQHRLQHVARIHGSVGLACPHDQVQLIDEEDNVSFALPDFLQHSLQTFLKFTPVLGSGHQGPHVQGKDLLVLQAFRHIPVHDPLRQAFHHGGLAHAGLPDQHRVVLGLPGKNTDHIPDLRIPADHRIQLLAARLFHQILPVFVQCIIGCFRIVAHDPLVPAHGGQGLQKTLPGDPEALKKLLDGRTRIFQHGKEQMLHRDILIPHGPGLILRGYQRLVQIRTETKLSAGHLDSCIQGFFHLGHKSIFMNLHLFDQLQDQTVFLLQQGIQQMLLLDLLIAVFIGNLLQILHRLHGILCKFADIHRTHLLTGYRKKHRGKIPRHIL